MGLGVPQMFKCTFLCLLPPCVFVQRRHGAAFVTLPAVKLLSAAMLDAPYDRVRCCHTYLSQRALTVLAVGTFSSKLSDSYSLVR